MAGSLGIVAAEMQKPRVERLARILLTLVPPGASEAEMVRAACLRWNDLKTPIVGQVVELAETLQEEINEMGKMHGKNTQDVRDAAMNVTEALYREEPDLERPEMFKRVSKVTGLDCTFGSWQTMYFYPAKKAVDAEKAVGKPPKEAAAKPPAEGGGGGGSGSGNGNGNGNGGHEIYTESLQVLEAELAALDERREVIRGAMWALERLVT